MLAMSVVDSPYCAMIPANKPNRYAVFAQPIQAPIPDRLCDRDHILSAVFKSALAHVQARDKAHRHLQRAIATSVKPGSLDDVRPMSGLLPIATDERTY